MKVAKKSTPGSVAGAIAGSIRAGETAELECIGMLATYIAAKAIAIATIFLQRDGISIATEILMKDKKIGNKEVTAYVFSIKAK